jgi:hypothetical protein
MPFKTGQENVASQQKRRIAELEADLVYERTTKPMLRDFAKDLGEVMLVKLANTPYDLWPEFAKNAFQWVRPKAPTAAYLYLNNLPKAKSE